MAYQKVMISGVNTADLIVLKEQEKLHCCGNYGKPAARQRGQADQWQSAFGTECHSKVRKPRRGYG